MPPDPKPCGSTTDFTEKHGWIPGGAGLIQPESGFIEEQRHHSMDDDAPLS
jgi:hypothetical protein